MGIEVIARACLSSLVWNMQTFIRQLFGQRELSETFLCWRGNFLYLFRLEYPLALKLINEMKNLSKAVTAGNQSNSISLFDIYAVIQLN